MSECSFPYPLHAGFHLHSPSGRPASAYACMHNFESDYRQSHNPIPNQSPVIDHILDRTSVPTNNAWYSTSTTSATPAIASQDINVFPAKFRSSGTGHATQAQHQSSLNSTVRHPTVSYLKQPPQQTCCQIERTPMRWQRRLILLLATPSKTSLWTAGHPSRMEGALHHP